MARSNFQAMMDQRSELLHRQSVWQELIGHLRKFLDTDAAPAKHGIVTQGGGMVVPQPVIEAVIVEIQDTHQAEILKNLQQINESEVAENVPEELEERPKREAQGRKKSGRQPSTKN